MPNHVLCFLQNAILKAQNDEKFVEEFELVPWFKFKDRIFDIYDHKIRNAPEIMGSVNASYCSLSEHILIYFIEKYRKRPLAEEKLFSFLINLRYYNNFWQRAKQFGRNVEIILPPLPLDLQLKGQEGTDGSSDGSPKNDEFGDP